MEKLQKTPALRYFKHNEAKGLSGEFAGWDADTANQKILSLASVICATKPLYGITSGLIVKKLRANIGQVDVPKRKLRSVRVPTEPYEYCTLNFRLLLSCRTMLEAARGERENRSAVTWLQAARR